MQTGRGALRWSLLWLPCFAIFLLNSPSSPLWARPQDQSTRRIPERPPASTATLQGLIRDSRGRALPGVQVDLRSTTSDQHYSAATDVEGIFRLRDVRLGVYEVKLAREGFQTQIIPNFRVNGPVTVLELALRESNETVPAAGCSAGVPGAPCTLSLIHI